VFCARRDFLAGLAAGALFGLPATAVRGQATPFSAASVDRIARRLAAAPYRPPPTDLPADLAGLGYDGYRGLRRSRDRLIFPQSPIRLEPMPRGGPLYRERIELFAVEDGQAAPVAFDPAAFYEVPRGVTLPNDPGLGFSGFRLFGNINRPDLLDEIAVFQGASYFRAVSRGTLYGLSARGIALGVAGPQPEEFPVFRVFWIERPAGEGIRVHALLDGPSLAGAFHMDIRPGETTRFDIEARLYPRTAIGAVCVAPMSSMFRSGPASARRFDDYRPAVHDSDGLEMWNGAGERLWRPLGNPEGLTVSAFADRSPRGFGLMQRARAFRDFNDAEAHYELRPSLWVEPLDPWGAGSVQLVEIPTDSEYHDNIVAFWRPERPWPARREVRLRYRLHWGANGVAPNPLLRVVATQSGARFGGGAPTRFYAIDFAADRESEEGNSLRTIVSASAGRVLEPRIEPIPGNRLRANFLFEPPAEGGADLRVALAGGSGPIGETCLLKWPS
jgi:glucans biosynthesis protein